MSADPPAGFGWVAVGIIATLSHAAIGSLG